MSYQDVISEKRRLTVLRCLADQNDYALNTSVMKSILAQLGFTESSTTIENDYIWLGEQNLITQSKMLGVTVGKITEHGVDVSKGVVKCSGVARPSPD